MRNTRANDVEVTFAMVNETLSTVKKDGSPSKAFRVTTINGTEVWLPKSQATRLADAGKTEGLTTDPQFCTFNVAGWLANKIDGKPVMG